MTARAVAGVVTRTHVRATLGWAAMFATVVYTSAYGYAVAYPTPMERLGLQASLGDNVGIAALFGRPETLATAGGFTAWRAGGVLLIVGMVWGILLGTRILRGEEEAGRWELVLAGGISARRATAATLAGAAGLLGVVWLLSAVGSLAAGDYVPSTFGVANSALLATALIGPAAFGIALGACCGELVGTRRHAGVVAGSVAAVLFVARMLAAVYPSATWLPWLDPLCWFDRTAPLTRNRPGWLIACWLLIVVLGAITIALAGRRDLGAALVAGSGRRERTPRAVGGQFALTSRLNAGTAAGWLVVLGFLAMVVGILSGPIGQAAARSAGMRQIFVRMAGNVDDASQAFLGLTVVTMTTVLCLCGGALVVALRDEESSDRLTNLLSRTTTRTSWLAVRVAVAALALIAGGTLVGVGMLLGTRIGTPTSSAATLLAAGLNTVPVALLVFAIGIAVFGVLPRLGGAAVYAVVAVSFVIEMVGSMVRAPSWVLDLSVLHHLALAPAVPIRLSTDIVLLLIAVGALGVGLTAFRRRDIVEA